MAENQFRLRPVTDIHVEHGLYPAESSLASILISEDVPDDDVGYIYAMGDEIATEEQSSSWGMNGDIPSTISKVTQITAFLRGKKPYTTKAIKISDEHYLSLNIDGKNAGEVFIASFGTEWNTYSVNITDAINIINEYIDKNKSFPKISAMLRSYMLGRDPMGSVSEPWNYPITQLYLEFTYEENTSIGIFDKVNGKQKAATAVYQKVGGTWSEISDAEAKTILKNNDIRRG